MSTYQLTLPTSALYRGIEVKRKMHDVDPVSVVVAGIGIPLVSVAGIAAYLYWPSGLSHPALAAGTAANKPIWPFLLLLFFVAIVLNAVIKWWKRQERTTTDR